MRPILLSVVLFCFAGAGFAGESEEPTVQVTATGTVEREPEQARLTLAVEMTETTAQGAAQANAEKMGRVLQRLRGLGLPKGHIRTVSYNLTAKYERGDHRRPDPKPIGYTAQNTVQVTIDSVGQVGQVIDASIGAGANRIAGLAYQLRDREAAYLEALGKAVKRARVQAEALAEAAGQELGPPHRISTTSGVRFAESVPMQASLRASAPTPIEGGTVQVTATVTAHYRIVDPSGR